MGFGRERRSTKLTGFEGPERFDGQSLNFSRRCRWLLIRFSTGFRLVLDLPTIGFRLIQDRRHKSISHSRDGLNIFGGFRIVPQQMTKFPDGRIDAVIGINKNIALPEPLNDFPSRNQATLL